MEVQNLSKNVEEPFKNNLLRGLDIVINKVEKNIQKFDYSKKKVYK